MITIERKVHFGQGQNSRKELRGGNPSTGIQSRGRPDFGEARRRSRQSDSQGRPDFSRMRHQSDYSPSIPRARLRALGRPHPIRETQPAKHTTFQ